METPIIGDTRFVGVNVLIVGPNGSDEVVFALDTGSSRTLVNRSVLYRCGYDRSHLRDDIQIATPMGKAMTTTLFVHQISSLGVSQSSFRVVAHQLPTQNHIDGLLGLDFLQNRILTVDFVRGIIRLRPPRPWWQFWK